MKNQNSSLRLLRRVAIITTLGLGGLFTADVAHAAEIKFGEGPSSLAVDDEGKLTDAGRKTAVKELDKIPGEDAWDLRVWAKLDKGKGGPLYVEFWQTVEVMGKSQKAKVWHHEDSQYEAQKYVNYNMVLEGKVGFNKGRTYDVYFVQVDKKGKDIRIGSAKLKLINTGREPDPGDEAEKKKKEEEEASAQDELDGLSGPDEEEEEERDPEPDEAPPETEASKKGCSVDSGSGFNGALILLLLGAAAFTRRRS